MEDELALAVLQENYETALPPTSLGGGGMVVRESLNPHGGAWNGKASVQLTGDWALSFLTLPANTHSDLISTTWYKFGSLFTAGVIDVHGFRGQGSDYESDCDVVFNPATGKWGVAWVDGAGAWHEDYESGISTLIPGSYVELKLRYRKHSTQGLIQLWVNGALKVSLSNLNTSYASLYIAEVNDGVVWVTANEPAVREVFYDDTIVESPAVTINYQSTPISVPLTYDSQQLASGQTAQVAAGTITLSVPSEVTA